jgi:hypothetical protein
MAPTESGVRVVSEAVAVNLVNLVNLLLVA